LEGDWREAKRIAEEAVNYGQETVSMLSESPSADELAWAYVLTSLSMVCWDDYFEERRAEFVSLISSYMGKGVKLAEKTGDAYLLFFTYRTLTHNSAFVKLDLPAAWRYAEETLRQSEKSRDHYLMGFGHAYMAGGFEFEAVTEEDPEEFKEKAKQAMMHLEKDISHFLLVCQYGHAAYGHAHIVEGHIQFAERETDPERKRVFLQQAVKIGLQGSEYANLSGSPWRVMNIYHSLSKALFFLSETEPNFNEKKRLLKEAADLREKAIRIGDQFNRPEAWDNGINQNYLALINADLAQIEESEDKKRQLLEEAVEGMEKCLQVCTKYLMKWQATSLPKAWANLGWYHDWFGQVLNQLYSLTKDEKVIDRSIQVYESAAKTYQKAGMPSRVAEAYWKAAKLYDVRGEFSKAADSFEQASRNYSLVSEKIPQLKDFYHDHAAYMQAWSKIEEARHDHARQEYGLAKEHFEKAGELLKSLKQWSYLAPNYSAWAELEQAEELSRKEQPEEAAKSFEKAAKLFTETEESLRTQLSNIESSDEEQMATGMLKTTDLRHEYCMARMTLEEARILDKRGDHYSSAEKYGSAAETFEKITEALDSEQDKKELRLASTFSRAWQKMTRAEAEASPALYFEASQLFEEAKEFGPSERIKMLTLGHSRFCRALEAGTKFIDTRDATLHDAVIQHLGSAADYYVKAGFQNASEYAKATKLLFEAYVHIGNAERETDPEKKAKLYTMAERILQTSVGSFMKAEHPEKREQVLRLLEKVKEERELAISLAEVLHAPAIVSATTAFSTPAPNHESAVGLERFEHADIQANLITSQKELKIGESLNLEIELVNAGKGPALLIKLSEVIPEGFDLTGKPEVYRVEDSYLNMKGKRLDPLKTEEVKLVLKPKVQGVFPLKPTVLYLDENGKYKSHEPEPITITVKELGIKGWIKGEK
jgi:tetratricopeptide (TPR) repeat protein